MNRHLSLFYGLAAALILSGCSTPSTTPGTPPAPKPEPEPPQPVKLAPLPEYGPERSGYNNSAVCLLKTDVEKPAEKQILKQLNKALTQRGYKIAELQNFTTAEERARVDKILSIQYVASRSAFLPQSDQTAIDTFIVVGVTEAPRRLEATHKAPRYFQAFGRDPNGKPQWDMDGATTDSVAKAVNNLFTLPAFRQALAPKQ